MTKIATMGTSSCATFAINGFKPEDIDMEKVFRVSTPKDRKVLVSKAAKAIQDWYKEVLYPIDQKLGHSKDHSFSAIMQAISAHPQLNKKYLIATLPSYCLNLTCEGYWGKVLKWWGFELVTSTVNSTVQGSVNHILVRDLAKFEGENPQAVSYNSLVVPADYDAIEL